MDIRKRILAARLSVRIQHNEEYCKGIGIVDRSGFKEEKQQPETKRGEQ